MEKIHEFAARKIYRHMDLHKIYDIIKNNIKPIEKIRIDVKDSNGYVLAEDIHSPYDRPLYNISHVDGYAFRYEDLKNTINGQVKLRIVKGIDPRKAHKYELRRGEAVFVETGYPLPIGADTVAPIEDTRLTDEHIIIPKKYKRGDHVFPKSTDYRRGEMIVRKGIRINPLTIKALLDLGIGEVEVYRKPRVIIYSVGDELVDEPFSNEEWKLPMSTKYLDKHVIEFYGGTVIHEEKLPDDPCIIAKTMKEDVEKADLLITIGGVSMGPKDHSWISIYEEFNPRNYWRGTKIHPARSTSGMILGNKLIINQPGLHQSSLSALFFIIIPVINYLQGLGLEPNYPYSRMIVEKEYIDRKYVDHYRLRPVVVANGKAKVINTMGSYYLKPLLKSNGFIILKPGVEHVKENSLVNVFYMPPINYPPSTNSLG